MPLERRWIARCDAPGCTESIIFDPIPDGEKWDYGEAMNDKGWFGGPARPQVFCTAHEEHGIIAP